MYRVIKYFIDLEDNNHVYSVGDKYPYTGMAKPERVAFLSSYKNKLGAPVIKAVDEPSVEVEQAEEPTEEKPVAAKATTVKKSNSRGKKKG